MIVIGAGMAGLLAASVMRNECERILEAQPELPDNHSAVLRFKSSVVGDTCNIPFKKVRAIKSYLPWKNKIADVMAYSDKSNGDYRIRSIITADGQVVERYVAPPDFTSQLVHRLNCEIKFNYRVNTLHELRSWNTDFISTLPMPLLMNLLEYDGQRPEFREIPGVNIMCRIRNCHMYCSLYIPDPDIGPYRVSINGDRMIAEVALTDGYGGPALLKDVISDVLEQRVDRWRRQALDALEIPFNRVEMFSFAKQRYMKILPIDEAIRQRFIIWATDKHKVYSLGRFATWRPNILLDDIVNDVRVIQRIQRMNNYDQRKFENT